MCIMGLYGVDWCIMVVPSNTKEDVEMKFDALKISVLCNTIEQMSATAEDKGSEDFGIRLTHEDAKMLVHGLIMLGNGEGN